MNKLIFTSTFFGILFFSSAVKAQDNTLPTQGNVGIGTMNPTSRLDVNGTMKVDSCLIVKDTLITLHDARIGETLKVEGDIVAPNLGQVADFDAAKLLFVDDQGFILKGDSDEAIEHLSGIIYSKQCPADPFADVPNPVVVNVDLLLGPTVRIGRPGRVGLRVRHDRPLRGVGVVHPVVVYVDLIASRFDVYTVADRVVDPLSEQVSAQDDPVGPQDRPDDVERGELGPRHERHAGHERREGA